MDKKTDAPVFSVNFNEVPMTNSNTSPNNSQLWENSFLKKHLESKSFSHVPLRKAIMSFFSENPSELSALLQSRTLFYWLSNTRFCSKCGAKNQATKGGTVLQCSKCNIQHFPKIEPASIMLIHNRENNAAILGRQAAWEPG